MEKKEKSLVETINESTEKLDKKNLKLKLKELEEAYKASDRAKLYDLSEDFNEIAESLGNDDESVLKDNLDLIYGEIEKNGANELNIAKAKNIKAKLGIIKYRPVIKEASNIDEYSYPVLDKKITDRRNALLIGGSMIAIFGLMAGCSISNRVKENNNTDNITTITSTMEGSTLDGTEGQTVGSTTNGTTTSGFTLETVDVDYSSPTRETTVSDGTYVTVSGTNGTNGTIVSVNPTTAPDTVTVISTPTTTAATTAPTETSTIPTNASGQKIDESGNPVETTYIAPTGTDPLPVEPTNSTLPSESLYSDPTTAPTTSNSTTTPTTTTSTEPVSTTIEVPVETVDPNDPNNVIELSISTPKILGLKK